MIAEPIAGYYLDDESSARVETTAPLGSIGRLDDEGTNGYRSAVVMLPGRTVFLPTIRPEQYEIL